jgi:hypothetical protein
MISVHIQMGVDVVCVFDGALDPDAPVTVESENSEICEARLVSYDPATFTAVAAFEHGSVIGTTAIRVRGDGDLGPGVTGVIWEETFESLPPAGASAVVATVSGERPTPTAPPVV